MELTVTQPAFVWIFGILGVLFAVILILVAVVLAYVAVLLRFVNEKSKEVGHTVDTVREVVEESAESFNETRRQVASIVGAAVNANMIGNLVRTVRNAWHAHEAKRADAGSVADAFDDVDLSDQSAAKKRKTKE